MNNLAYISKDQSVIFKGCAILMMIWLHLFNWMGMPCEDGSFFFVGGMTLSRWLTAAMGPVPLYVFASGYGLYYAYLRASLTWKNNLRRAAKLYVVYWVALAIFVGLGCYLRPQSYPGSWLTAFQSLTGWYTNPWNAEAWFLFPYILLMLSSHLLFRFANKMGFAWSIGLSTIGYYGACFLISRYGGQLFDNMLIYHPVLYVQSLPTFFIGAALCKYANTDNLQLVDFDKIMPFRMGGVKV